eukprot:Gb_35827 [translate_table: standard]
MFIIKSNWNMFTYCSELLCRCSQGRMQMEASVRAAWMMFMFTVLLNVNGQSDSCNGSVVFSNLDLSTVPFEASSLHCSPVWSNHNYILRYSQNATNIWNFLLSAPNMNCWVGMGFSKNGFMVGSSAVVGWIDQNGSGRIKQYYLGGQLPSLVKADQGELDIVNNYSTVFVQGSTIYIAFQLQFNTPRTSANILYALGPQNVLPINYVLTQHQDEVATAFDFSTGTSSRSSSTDTLRRNHGILNILGWGVLLPLGVIIARYFRQWDPIWFYLHIGFQVSGFILGVVAVAMGISLYNKLNSDVDAHRALGIFILSLGALQVLALLLRPQKESKVRKYWNWYHYWFGRILLVIAVVNIFYGIHVASAGTKWNVGYGVTVGFLLVTAAVLESILLIKWFKRPAQTPSFPVYDTNI